MKREIKNYEYKSLTGELKDVDVKQGIVTGYFAHFGNLDSANDIIEKGAFTKTINERGVNGKNQILHLLQHDPMKPIGKPYVLKEDDFGLYFESKIVNTQIGIDVLKLYEAGVYNEHSIGYKTIRYEYVEGNQNTEPYWILKELKLYEGSTVSWGANDMTPFLGFKSNTEEDAYSFLDKKMDSIMKALRTDGLSDEAYECLDLQSKQIKSAYRNIPSLLIKSQPTTAIGTGEEQEPKNENKNAINIEGDKDLQEINQLKNNLIKIFQL